MLGEPVQEWIAKSHHYLKNSNGRRADQGNTDGLACHRAGQFFRDDNPVWVFLGTKNMDIRGNRTVSVYRLDHVGNMRAENVHLIRHALL